MAQRMLSVLLVSWLVVVARSASVPQDDGGDKPPPPFSDDVAQVEVVRGQLPLHLLRQHANSDQTLEGFNFPVLVHGEPQDAPPAGFSPRGKRPGCFADITCPRHRYKLDEFPPARPSLDNIGNICAEGRKKLSYGPWNLPQTGFSHLMRQGDALNALETSMDRCCQMSDQEKLPCCSNAWSDTLAQFCEVEFSIKTRPYHCCRMRESRRERCFDQDAPSPYYGHAKNQGAPTAKPNARMDPSRCGDPTEHVAPQAAPKIAPKIAFPPGEPTEANFNNICKLRKVRPRYPAGLLPRSNFVQAVLQARAVNRLEKEFKTCCQEGGIACAHKGWESTLIQYCKQEFSVKTRPHICCKASSQDARLTCFAGLAPYPAYDKELTSVNLADITPSLLGSLCGQFTVLTNTKPIPALVQNITEPCCQLEGEERIQCAEEKKSTFIANLCSAQKKTWNDSKRCCAQEGDQARVACFNLNYLNNVALGTVEQQVPPTKPAV